MKVSRIVSVVTAAAALGLGVVGSATAAVTPAAGATCTTEPLWTASTTVSGNLKENQSYTVKLPTGTFSAEWSSAYNLAVNYTKTSGGGDDSGTYEVFDIHTVMNANGVATQTCGWGPGVDTWSTSLGGHEPFMFAGSNQPPAPYDDITANGGSKQQVIAVVFSKDKYYAIGFSTQIES